MRGFKSSPLTKCEACVYCVQEADVCVQQRAECVHEAEECVTGAYECVNEAEKCVYQAEECVWTASVPRNTTLTIVQPSTLDH